MKTLKNLVMITCLGLAVISCGKDAPLVPPTPITPTDSVTKPVEPKPTENYKYTVEARVPAPAFTEIFIYRYDLSENLDNGWNKKNETIFDKLNYGNVPVEYRKYEGELKPNEGIIIDIRIADTVAFNKLSEKTQKEVLDVKINWQGKPYVNTQDSVVVSGKRIHTVSLTLKGIKHTKEEWNNNLVIRNQSFYTDRSYPEWRKDFGMWYGWF